MNVLVPMAGSGDAFIKKGYHYPKNIVEITGKPLVQHVYENLSGIPGARFIFIVKKEEVEKFHLDNILRLLNPDCQIIILDDDTSGAACSALLAIEYINNELPLVIANGDQIICSEIGKIINHFQQRDVDGGIVTFESLHPRWSYVRIDENGSVVETAEKRPISKYATAGVYYFKKGKDFLESTMDMIRKDASVEGKFFVCPVYNEMILRQAKVEKYDIKRSQYYPLSSPQGVQEYEAFLKSKGGADFA